MQGFLSSNGQYFHYASNKVFFSLILIFKFLFCFCWSLFLIFCWCLQILKAWKQRYKLWKSCQSSYFLTFMNFVKPRYIPLDIIALINWFSDLTQLIFTLCFQWIVIILYLLRLDLLKYTLVWGEITIGLHWNTLVFWLSYWDCEEPEL